MRASAYMAMGGDANISPKALERFVGYNRGSGCDAGTPIPAGISTYYTNKETE
jgi:hypothetical protein